MYQNKIHSKDALYLKQFVIFCYNWLQFVAIVGSQGRKICNFYGSTEMSDVTFAVFTSLEDLYEQMDDSNKV